MPLLGNVSRKNFYQVEFGGIRPNLRTYMISRGVDSRFMDEGMGLMCYSAQLPGAALATVESSNYHGINEKFAHRRIYNTLSLSFYCDDEYRGLKFIEHWMEYSISGNSSTTSQYNQKNYSVRMRYPDDPVSGYKSEGTKIYKFERNLDRLMEYSFIGMFPSSLSATSVQYENQGELLDINCTFTYDRHIAGSISSVDTVRGLGNNIVGNLVNSGLSLLNL